jgi:hypothetical protein
MAPIFGMVAQPKKREVHRGIAVAGIVVGCVALVPSIVGVRIVTNATHNLETCLNTVSSDLTNGTHNTDTVCTR